jgi:hypothetical protein
MHSWRLPLAVLLLLGADVLAEPAPRLSLIEAKYGRTDIGLRDTTGGLNEHWIEVCAMGFSAWI